MSFQKRRHWESMFEDGVVVEGIETGENPSLLLREDEEDGQELPAGKAAMASAAATSGYCAAAEGSGSGMTEDASGEINPALPEASLARKNLSIARKTDDVMTFLQTVELAGVPHGMAIAFLNDPERQHALAHLRKQMMLSNPQECMLCQGFFQSSADIRCCPW